MKLLHIESSPRKDRSKSIEVASAFLDAYRATHPDDEVQTIDLWDRPMPEFDGDVINARYAVLHGKDHTDAQRQAWQQIVDVCDEFKSADKYLFSVPMWNFGIPYKLKHYIDLLAQPGHTFSFDPETGFDGLVKNKPTAVVYARGGAYSSGDAQSMDLQKGYLDVVLGFIGLSDIKNIVIEPTLADPAEVEKTIQSATDTAKQIAANF